MNVVFKSLALAAWLAVAPEAWALIEGGTGNEPIRDPGWPHGAAALVNHPERIAYWVGPPFGGGQWHAECRGDAKTIAEALAAFAKLDVRSKRLVVHDGVGHSFWLAPNHEPEKLAAAKLDWSFTVWEPASWKRLKELPPDLNPLGANDEEPPAQLDVYVGAMKWAEVPIP